MQQASLRASFIGYPGDKIVTAQQDPFVYYKRDLKQQINLEVSLKQISHLSQVVDFLRSDRSDIYFFMPDWREEPDEVEAHFQTIRSLKKREKLIFVDPFAQATTRFLNVLPYVDGFVKRQRYLDQSLYTTDRPGGSVFTQYLAEQWHYDLGSWHIGSVAPNGHESRILTGWSLGVSKGFRDLLNRPHWLSPPTKKTIDIFSRIALGNELDTWYYPYRLAALNALRPLTTDYTVAMNQGTSSKDLVPKRQYFRELRKSRIVFSPFGWGESCWRDFEAVCYDCLLIKPSMEHLDIQPNLFIPGKTYVPVAWDFSDLESKCRYYLEHPKAADEIIQRARQAYLEYFKSKQFITQISQLLEGNSSNSVLGKSALATSVQSIID